MLISSAQSEVEIFGEAAAFYNTCVKEGKVGYKTIAKNVAISKNITRYQSF